MTRKITLPAIVFTLFAAPAFAQDNCAAPTAPTVPDGKTATAAEIIAANREVVAFIRASDTYQTCLVTLLNTETEKARAERKTVDPKLKADLEARGDANQKQKEEVGQAYNTSAAAYRAAHPR